MRLKRDKLQNRWWVGSSSEFFTLRDGGGCRQRDIHMVRDAALLIGLALPAIGYWGRWDGRSETHVPASCNAIIEID